MGRLYEDAGETARKTYPLSKKAPTEKEPEWTLKLEEWGTNKEIEALGYANKKKYRTTSNNTKRACNETPSQTSAATGNYISVERRIEISQREQKKKYTMQDTK